MALIAYLAHIEESRCQTLMSDAAVVATAQAFSRLEWIIKRPITAPRENVAARRHRCGTDGNNNRQISKCRIGYHIKGIRTSHWMRNPESLCPKPNKAHHQA